METGIEVLAVLIVVLMITIVVARSMVRPLRKLRTGALEVAGLRLPETVRRMSETDGEGVSLEVEPIDVDSSDEIGEVARAFDQVHREALRLAANEAALRGNVNAMFVNLSRRSQSLVERQIRLIDDLEQGEQDPERLSSLFQMDHLATRMRRNSENLLVLAGHDESRRWNQPVALVDVLRAALSEIEQYERVTLNVQPGIAVRGQAVSDVVHLTAELVENATSFSAAGHAGHDRRAPAEQRGSAARDHRPGRRHGGGRDGPRQLAAGQPAGGGRGGLASHGPVRGRPAGGQARHQGPAASRSLRRPDRPGLAAR